MTPADLLLHHDDHTSDHPYGDTTVAELLLRRSGDDRPGLRTLDETWTWDEVVRECARRAALAARLRGVGPFHIGILLENVPEYAFWLGAAALAGATLVGINSTRRGEYLEQEVRGTDCQFIVTDSSGMELLAGLDVGVAEERFLLIDSPEYATLIDSLPAGSDLPVVAPDVTPATQFLLLFTSGSTGASKAVICSQRRFVWIAEFNVGRMSITPDDVCYCSMPMFHGNALMALWGPTLRAGGCVALAPKFSVSRFMPDVRAFGATYFTFVGKVIGYVLGTPEQPDDGTNPLIRGFGTEASPADRIEFARRFNCRLLEGFGSSEVGGLVLPDPTAPPTALGRRSGPHVQVVDSETGELCAVAVFDEHGRVLNAEEAVGSVIDADGEKKFEGYYKNPEANAEKIRDGAYWTGDLGYLDAHNFLYFAGREGDWIRVDSENISSLHIERVVLRHPAITVASVFAVPDPRAGDQVMAAIEVAADVAFEGLELAEFLVHQSDLGTKDMPRYVRVSTGLPVTGSGKVAKKDVKVQGWRTEDPVYRWVGRGQTVYTLMSDVDKEALREEFRVNERLRFLG